MRCNWHRLNYSNIYPGTGYRSHYCQIDELEDYDHDPVGYMRQALDHYYTQSPAWQRQQDTAWQYSLF